MNTSNLIYNQTENKNPTLLIPVFKYNTWIITHILKDADLKLHLKVVYLFEETEKLINKVKSNLLIQEECF